MNNKTVHSSYKNDFKSIFSPYILRFLEMKEMSGSKLDNILATLREFDRFVLASGLESVCMTQSDITLWRNNIYGKKATTIYMKFCIIGQFCRYLVKLGIPCYVPVYPRKPKEHYAPYIFSKEELDDIFNAADELELTRRDFRVKIFSIPVLLRLLYSTGMRIGEAANLKNSDVDMVSRSIIIRDSKNRRVRCKNAADAAEAIGIGLQSFCIPGSVADDRKVGLGHGNLAARLLREETKCFAFLAGHESFAAAEGAIKIAAKADKVRKEPLRCILNGLGKDAAQIISRINGFTYVQTQFDYYTGELKVVREIAYSKGERAKVKCYGADDVREGVAIMWHEGVDVSITGNSTNPTRFQHPVAGTYKKECVEKGKKYFSVASGGGTGRTLHPDNMAAGPASYGMTDTMGRMHSDAQFAGSSSVPAHVEMMGFLGIGNNPMVGCTVACAVDVAQALSK